MPGIFEVTVPITRFVTLLVASICGCIVLIKQDPNQVLHPKENVCQSYQYIPSVAKQSFGFVRPKQVSVDRPCCNIETEGRKKVRPLHR